MGRVWHNYKAPPTYTLGSEGCGCYLEPPNHPTYFVRSIWTRFGNSPRNGPQYYLNGNGYEDLDDVAKLLKPLPIDNPRVIAWIKAVYRHMNHCYRDPAHPDGIVIFPVGDWQLKRFVDDPRFSEEWRAKEKASIEQANKEIIANAEKLAFPENHSAVLYIQKYYPDHKPDLGLIENPPKSIANWWTKLDAPPKPEECPGEIGRSHPVNVTWCQFCGWHADNEHEKKE